VVRSTGTPLRSFLGGFLTLFPTIFPGNATSRERDPKADHSGCTTLRGLKSPVRSYATALLCNARPVASGLALIRSRVKLAEERQIRTDATDTTTCKKGFVSCVSPPPRPFQSRPAAGGFFRGCSLSGRKVCGRPTATTDTTSSEEFMKLDEPE
jgi:hypothetical protein